MKHALLTLWITLALLGCSQEDEQQPKFYGNVDVKTVSLAFQVGGKLEHLYFDEGERVYKGDKLATLESTLYQEQLNQITAQVDVQKAQIAKLEKGYRPEEIEKARASMEQKYALMTNAQKTLARYKALLAEHSVTQEKYDAVETAYQSANALYLFAKNNLMLLENGYNIEDILSAKAKLRALIAQKNQAKLKVAYTTLYAPSNGTVLTRVYEEGSVINPSATLFEIAMEDTYWVRGYLSERYLGKIKPGMKVDITTDSTQHYEGVVSFISPLAEFTPKSVQTEDLRTDLVYRFKVRLLHHDTMIKQGMPVTITFAPSDTTLH